MPATREKERPARLDFRLASGVRVGYLSRRTWCSVVPPGLPSKLATFPGAEAPGYCRLPSGAMVLGMGIVNAPAVMTNLPVVISELFILLRAHGLHRQLVL